MHWVLGIRDVSEEHEILHSGGRMFQTSRRTTWGYPPATTFQWTGRRSRYCLIRRLVKDRDKRAKLVVAVPCISCTYPKFLDSLQGRFFEKLEICLRQAQLAPEEVQRKNAVGKGSITNLEYKAEDATDVFADVFRFSRPTVVPHEQKSLWERVV